jgi:hypothetical protein
LESHYKNIFNQIRRVVTRPLALEAVVRTRFSKGYKISSFVTPILISNNDLMIMPILDSDQSFAVSLDMTIDTSENGSQTMQANAPEPYAYVQVS